jgi:succinyl-CoA synthetase beta subunit
MDCKLVLDDNAAFRQKEIFQTRDASQEDAMEVRAAKADLNFINLTGNIGCMGELGGME